MRTFIAALRFLTRVPVPGPDTRVEDLAGAVGWFPLVGALVGFATSGMFLLTMKLWAPPLAAVLAIAFGLLLTGGFHEDGLTDAVDGLGGGFTKDRVIEIMKDSRIGAYGAMALWCMLSLRWVALWQLGDKALWAVPLAMVWGRWSIAWMLRMLPPISQGLAKEVHKGLGRGPFLMSTALLMIANIVLWRLGIALLWRPAAAAVVMAAIWAFYLKRRLGGHSGDLLGAGNQLVEAAALLALLAR